MLWLLLWVLETAWDDCFWTPWTWDFLEHDWLTGIYTCEPRATNQVLVLYFVSSATFSELYAEECATWKCNILLLFFNNSFLINHWKRLLTCLNYWVHLYFASSILPVVVVVVVKVVVVVVCCEVLDCTKVYRSLL